ncbi:DinB family protein [Ornithinibacillus sp. BX22]|uniref:DinB family protein n=1 Tax=Ornithinibacillus hominis TaxID=2763055 RepID=A0A923L886_9BACI|nr:DinB family protein [Ornithinibacillus hominis]MBC5638340.1 DinB family protein [Ornithinibacillus hominis]
MNFKLDEALEILERTPKTLESLLFGLSVGWLHVNEGESTWNASEVVEHLIEAEKEDWLPRVASILVPDEDNHFPPYDRFAHLNKADRSIDAALAEFARLRVESIEKLQALIQDDSDFKRLGIHPEFGEVTLEQLISTWVVHDLTHITQIARVMAKRYQKDVGPWVAYLGVLN